MGIRSAARSLQKSTDLKALFETLYGEDAPRILLDSSIQSKRATLLLKDEVEFETAGKLCANLCDSKWAVESQAPKPSLLKTSQRKPSGYFRFLTPPEIAERFLPRDLRRFVAAIISKLTQSPAYTAEREKLMALLEKTEDSKESNRIKMRIALSGERESKLWVMSP